MLLHRDSLLAEPLIVLLAAVPTLKPIAPVKSAAFKLASSKSARVKLAPVRLGRADCSPVILADRRMASVKLALDRLILKVSIDDRSAPVKFAPLKSTFSKVAEDKLAGPKLAFGAKIAWRASTPIQVDSAKLVPLSSVGVPAVWDRSGRFPVVLWKRWNRLGFHI